MRTAPRSRTGTTLASWPVGCRSPGSLAKRVGWGSLVEPVRVGFGFVAPARWPRGAGDAGGGAEDQPPVGEQGEGPAAGEGLDPVVPAAEATEIPAGGSSAVGMGVAMVDVAATGAAAATGHSAGLV